MEVSSPKTKKFLIFFPKKTNPEKISYAFQRNPSHFSALASKLFSEKKKIISFPKKTILKKISYALPKKLSSHFRVTADQAVK